MRSRARAYQIFKPETGVPGGLDAEHKGQLLPCALPRALNILTGFSGKKIYTLIPENS